MERRGGWVLVVMYCSLIIWCQVLSSVWTRKRTTTQILEVLSFSTPPVSKMFSLYQDECFVVSLVSRLAGLVLGASRSSSLVCRWVPAPLASLCVITVAVSTH
eukprot:scaffold6572_cov175-Alexandrium_tamarense.AAC.4